MSLSQLARSIRESATLKLNETAALLRDKGEPIIHLGGGEPKSKAPMDAVINCAALLNTGEIRYTAPDGIPALKKAIVRYTEEHYKKIVSADNVIASGGAKQALMVLLHAILDPKEEVIFPAPYWVSYPEMVKLAGGVPVPVTAEDGTFFPTVKEMADACGSYTKAIILNSPNNPSGAMYSRDFVQEMVEFCEKKSLYLIIDDIYNRLVFDGKSAPIGYDFMKAPLEQSKLVVINGVSKMYAMTGFRIGWAIANQPLIEAMATIQSQQTSGPSSPGAVGGRGRAQRRAIVGRQLADHAREQPQRDAGTPARFRRRQSSQAGRHFLLLPGFQRLHEGFAEALQFPARESARSDRAGQGIRL
jgi:aspartate aminotransferase